MSESPFSDAGSQLAYATLGSTDMIIALGLMRSISREAKGVPGLEALSAKLQTLMRQLEGDLAALARVTAEVADTEIVAILRDTQVRPETTKSLHLEDVILSLPFAYGSVKVGIVDELNKATNAVSGYGPYWRAQEYGSEAVGNSMVGRVLFGRFEGPSHDEVPRGQYAGQRGAPGAEFYYSVEGEDGGLGTIGHEDAPRHFLAGGTDAAFAGYRDGITKLSRDFAGRILGLGDA